jgi:hypothetical protein
MRADLTAIVASAATRKAMGCRSDLDARGWAFWERRNLNLHRVVGLLQDDRRFADARALDGELRGALARNFKRGWWRGIAYGVVANAGSLALTPEDLKILVDARENPKGTMQWVILLAGDGRAATGVHTWIEGYLSPVYRDVLQELSKGGYQISSFMKEKDGLMRVLTAVADARARAYTGRAAFPEFRDPFLADGQNRMK